MGINISSFERSIGASNGYINSISKSIGIDKLLTGKGNMMRYGLPTAVQEEGFRRLPLVDISVMAGFGNGHFSIEEKDVKEYYVVPKFRHKKIDFMIEVEGSSMYPKYSSGDVVACTIIDQANFIQWNKAHVISTRDQGMIIKRVKKGITDHCLLMISDNENYDSFEVPVEQITGMALVVGVIRLE